MIVWKHHDKISDQLILTIENIVKDHFRENDIEKIYN